MEGTVTISLWEYEFLKDLKKFKETIEHDGLVVRVDDYHDTTTICFSKNDSHNKFIDIIKSLKRSLKYSDKRIKELEKELAKPWYKKIFRK